MGLRFSPRKVKTITKQARPTNVTEIRSFLGLASYDRRLVKDFFRIVSSPTNFFRKDIKFEKIEKCERVFQELRSLLLWPQS